MLELQSLLHRNTKKFPAMTLQAFGYRLTAAMQGLSILRLLRRIEALHIALQPQWVRHPNAVST